MRIENSWLVVRGVLSRLLTFSNFLINHCTTKLCSIQLFLSLGGDVGILKVKKNHQSNLMKL